MLTDRYKDVAVLPSFTYLLCRCEEYSCRLGINARVSSVHETGVVVHVDFHLTGFPRGKPTRPIKGLSYLLHVESMGCVHVSIRTKIKNIGLVNTIPS